MIKIKWTEDIDVTVIYGKEFDDLYPIAKADILKDALHELEVKYNQILQAGL